MLLDWFGSQSHCCDQLGQPRAYVVSVSIPGPTASKGRTRPLSFEPCLRAPRCALRRASPVQMRTNGACHGFSCSPDATTSGRRWAAGLRTHTCTGSRRPLYAGANQRPAANCTCRVSNLASHSTCALCTTGVHFSLAAATPSHMFSSRLLSCSRGSQSAKMLSIDTVYYKS